MLITADDTHVKMKHLSLYDSITQGAANTPSPSTGFYPASAHITKHTSLPSSPHSHKISLPPISIPYPNKKQSRSSLPFLNVLEFVFSVLF